MNAIIVGIYCVLIQNLFDVEVQSRQFGAIGFFLVHKDEISYCAHERDVRENIAYFITISRDGTGGWTKTAKIVGAVAASLNLPHGSSQKILLVFPADLIFWIVH